MVKKGSVTVGGDANAENAKLCAALSYLLIGIIWWVADEKMKPNTFVKFHAKQGLVLLIVDIIIWATFSILFVPFAFVGALWILWSVVSTIVWLTMLILLILGIINAVNGNEKELPVIGRFASIFTF